MALGIPFPVNRSVTFPCIKEGCPLGAGSWIMLPPRSRKGAFGDQKGPRIEEEVGSLPFSVMSLWAISSTSLRIC